jgi:3D (Asp-Asp-Asp) domain-containing protein
MKKELKETRMQNYLELNQLQEGWRRKIKITLAMLILLPIINIILVWNGIDKKTGHPEMMDIPVEKKSLQSIAVAKNNVELPQLKKMAFSSRRVEERIVSMSAYTSRVQETDSTPCISADGTNICKYNGCVVASNDYPFDTVIIVEGFGECMVKDRMSSRYTGTGNMDLYFGKDLEGALEFGRKNLKVKITS